MNKSRFISTIKNPKSLEDKSLQALEELALDHPYCQSIHVLIAKGYQLLSKEEFEKKLNHAAVYISDRKHLKAIIENDLLNQTSSNSNAQTSREVETLESKDSYSSEYLQKEITSYLDKLRKERTALDLQDGDEVSNEMAEEKASFKKDLDVRIAEAEAKLARIKNPVKYETKLPEVDDTAEDKAAEKEDNSLLYDELEENLNKLRKNKELLSGEEEEANVSTHQKQGEGPLVPLSNNIEKEKMEEYLASLKNSEAKLIENEKVREQIKIIDSFIESKPKLPKLDQGEEDKEKREDLSLRSSRVSANIASENLALIMAKQGKLQKAHDIYNKLIWKYPEKKAYFVARINELKEK